MTPLPLATFEEITEELVRRFPNMAVIVHKPIDDEACHQQRYRFEGDPNMVLGLLATLQYHVLMSKEDKTEATDDV